MPIKSRCAAACSLQFGRGLAFRAARLPRDWSYTTPTSTGLCSRSHRLDSHSYRLDEAITITITIIIRTGGIRSVARAETVTHRQTGGGAPAPTIPVIATMAVTPVCVAISMMPVCVAIAMVHVMAAETAVSNAHAAASAATNARSATSATSTADLDHETVVVIPGRKRGERPGHLRSGGNCACNDRGRGKPRQRESARKRGGHNQVLHLQFIPSQAQQIFPVVVPCPLGQCGQPYPAQPSASKAWRSCPVALVQIPDLPLACASINSAAVCCQIAFICRCFGSRCVTSPA